MNPLDAREGFGYSLHARGTGSAAVAHFNRLSYMGKAKVAILVAVIIATCFATVGLIPGPTRPNLSIKLMGWTNNPAGVQVGVISVSNQGAAKIFAYAPHIEVCMSTEPGGVASYGQTGHWGSILAGGSFRNFWNAGPD